MNRAAILGSLIGGTAATAIALLIVSSSSCIACSSSPRSEGSAPTTMDADDVDSAPIDSIASLDTADTMKLETRLGDGWFDGEYCPSAEFPPRTDGCPCWGVTDPRSPYHCSEATIGKVCEYFQRCPPGPSQKYRCEWYALDDGGRAPGWRFYESGYCPSNDGG